MADIFVSYASEDRERVRTLVAALEEQEWTVWWDTRITPGRGFDSEIQAALDAASCVLVIWSRHSITSEWVMTEASEGLERNILVPVCIDDVRPPLAFRRRQTLAIDSLKTAGQVVVPAVRAALEGESNKTIERPGPKPPRSTPLLISAGLVLCLLVGAAFMYFMYPPDNQSARSDTGVSVLVELKGWQDWRSLTNPTPSMVISPDGMTVVFVSRDDNGSASLMARRLDRLETIELTGTKGAEKPFFSPDGLWVAYVHGKLMKRISIDGDGAPVIIASLNEETWGATWGTDDRIYFSEGRSGIKSVSVSQGDEKIITRLDTSGSEQSHRLPRHVADHQMLLFSVFTLDGNYEVWALNLATNERRYLFDGGTPTYMNTGHIVYTKQGSLWRVPYDVEDMIVTGPAVTVLSAVAGGLASSAYAVANSGTLVYMPQQTMPTGDLVLRDPAGPTRVLSSKPAWFISPSFSNDGESIAVVIVDASGQESIWIYDIQSGAAQLFAKGASSPLWSPDDQSITFQKDSVGLVRQMLNGSMPPETLVSHDVRIFPYAWTDQGNTLVYNAVESESGGSLYVLEEGREPRRIHSASGSGEVSNDGRWFAACNWPRGIFVSRFPELKSMFFGPEHGCQARWGPDEAQLYYQETDKLWVVDIDVTENVSFGARRKIADLYHFGGFSQYDVDGRGRLAFTAASEDAPQLAVLLTNWANSLD